jgi:hypothetical protein
MPAIKFLCAVGIFCIFLVFLIGISACKNTSQNVVRTAIAQAEEKKERSLTGPELEAIQYQQDYWASPEGRMMKEQIIEERKYWANFTRYS